MRTRARFWRGHAAHACAAAILIAFAPGRAARAESAGNERAAPDSSATADSLAPMPADSLSATLAGSLAVRDSVPRGDPPADASDGADYEVERDPSLDAGEMEVGYSLASRANGRLFQRRRIEMREAGVEAEVREGRGDALSGAALGTRVPGGWLALGRASPRWGRGLLVGSPLEPWRPSGLAATSGAPRPRAGDAAEFRGAGRVAVDLIAARQGHDAFAALGFGTRAAALELALTRALDAGESRVLAGVRFSGSDREAEIALDDHGSWRLEAVRPAGDHGLSLGARLGHADFAGAGRPRTAPPGAALGASLRGSPRAHVRAALEGALWRFADARSGHRGALEVTADMAQHEAFTMGFEERRGPRRATAADAGALRQGVWAEWRRNGPGLAMNLRHEWWGESGGLAAPVRELVTAELESRPRPGALLGLTVWLHRTVAGEPQYLGESEIDRNIWRAVSGRGSRTRLRLGLPVAGGTVRASLTVSQSGGSSPPPQWTLDWSRRARARG